MSAWTVDFDPTADPVGIGGGYILPPAVTARYEPKGTDGPIISVQFDVTPEEITLRQFNIRRDRPGVSSADLAVDVEELKVTVLSQMARTKVQVSPGRWELAAINAHQIRQVRRYLRKLIGQNRGSRSVVSDSLLQEVAKVYRTAIRRHHRPRAAVRSFLEASGYQSCSNSTASKRIREARCRGFLDPAPKPGQAGEKG